MTEGSLPRAAISRLLRPRSVAVIGASDTPGSLGASVLGNLVRNGFSGEVYPINPKRERIGALKCLASVDDLPEGVDVAVLAIPQAAVLDAVRGLVLWASFPDAANSLSQTNLAVVSIYGTNDSAVEQLFAARNLMPASTQWVVIQGGNHAQFGYYGIQSGDGVATISREEQQKQVVDATIGFLKQIEN